MIRYKDIKNKLPLILILDELQIENLDELGNVICYNCHVDWHRNHQSQCIALGIGVNNEW